MGRVLYCRTMLAIHFCRQGIVDEVYLLLSRTIGLPLLVVSKVTKGSSIVRKYGAELVSTVLF